MNQEAAERVLGNLVLAIEMLENTREFTRLMPEVRVNLVYALPEAGTPDEVAGVDGRITVVRGFPTAAGIPRWGVSDHMARLIIEVRKYDASFNAGINFKCDDEIIEVVKAYCAERGLLFGAIDRTGEPPEAADSPPPPRRTPSTTLICVATSSAAFRVFVLGSLNSRT